MVAVPEVGIAMDRNQRVYFIARCSYFDCHAPFFAIFDPHAYSARIVGTYPYPNVQAEQFDDAIPEELRADFAEAHRCQYAYAHKSTVTMCRRVIEKTAILNLDEVDRVNPPNHRYPGQTKKLHELIDTMFAKGLLISALRDMAHEIRFFGNYGAHAQDDGLDEVTADEVDDMMQLTEQILHALYVAPSVHAQARAKRLAKAAE